MDVLGFYYQHMCEEAFLLSIALLRYSDEIGFLQLAVYMYKRLLKHFKEIHVSDVQVF